MLVPGFLILIVNLSLLVFLFLFYEYDGSSEVRNREKRLDVGESDKFEVVRGQTKNGDFHIKNMR
jgi:hypothetical protein